MYNQRPIMTRADLENELTLLLMSDVRGVSEPDSTTLRKANTNIQKIMMLVDRYIASK
jgi:hypothetical protein